MTPLRTILALAILGTLGTGCRPAPDGNGAVEPRLASARWVDTTGTLEVETVVPEPDPSGSFRRTVLSLVAPGGEELFRAVYCGSPRVDPIPPGAFGMYVLGGDGTRSRHEAVSAGIGGIRPAASGGFVLLPESRAVNRDGVLHLQWLILPEKPLPPGLYRVRSRVVGLDGREPGWTILAVLDTSGSSPVVATPPAAGEPGGPSPAGEDPVAGLRALPALLAGGRPLEEVEQLRKELLNRFFREKSLRTGLEEYTLAELRQVWALLLATPDLLHYELPYPHDLPLERFLYLCAVEGGDHVRPAHPGGTWALPAIDLRRALRSPDPWVVSGALFLARKNGVALDPATVVQRWKEGGLDGCGTEQAAFLLAGLPPERLAVIAEGDSGLPGGLEGLEPVPEDVFRCRPLFFFADAPLPPARPWADPEGIPVTAVFCDDTMEEIGRHDLALRHGVFELPPSTVYLSLEVLRGRIHGTSRQVQPEGGRFARLPIRLLAGV